LTTAFNSRDLNRKLFTDTDLPLTRSDIGKKLIASSDVTAHHVDTSSGTQSTSKALASLEPLAVQRSITLGPIHRTARLDLLTYPNPKRNVVPYDEAFHSERAIFFPSDERSEYRVLSHFYAYLYIADHHLVSD
jgi:hypothetical protein